MARTRRKSKLSRPKVRNVVAEVMITRTGGHAGPHHTRERDVKSGRSRKVKHKGRRSWDR